MSLFKVAEVTIGYKPTIPASKRIRITNSGMVVDALRTAIREEEIEHREMFFVLLLDKANKILGISRVSEGGLAGTVADPKIVFQVALKANASAIILAHNHPSGNLTPSGADIRLTEKLAAAGKFLDLPVLDHIILTAEYYRSMADMGDAEF